MGRRDFIRRSAFAAGAAAYDAKTGAEKRWDPGAGNGSGEWLFVASGDDEGEGFLLTYTYDTYDGAEDAGSLIVLDAQDAEAGPVGTVEIPQRVRPTRGRVRGPVGLSLKKASIPTRRRSSLRAFRPRRPGSAPSPGVGWERPSDHGATRIRGTPT
ncbi:MAG: carotenoid oxygenase family protein [Actinomycetota bacterium]|nr:carotenoid oxygenase family protein [Actinomycetota bacterium]